jgi:hypothetical protein
MKVRQRLAKRLDRATRVTLRNANRWRIAGPAMGIRLHRAYPLQGLCLVADDALDCQWSEHAHLKGSA